MKCTLVTPLIAVGAFVMSSCGDFGTSLDSQSFEPGMNPLDSPGRRDRSETLDLGPKFTPGSWVEVTDSNAGLYRKRGDSQAQFSLRPGTPLKVLGEQGTYVKVETEGGDIGYVPAIMVGSKPSGDELPIVSPEPTDLPPSIDPIDPLGPDPGPIEPLPTPGAIDDGFVAPEPEVPPISVEESPPPPAPVVPPDPPAPVVPPDPLEEQE